MGCLKANAYIDEYVENGFHRIDYFLAQICQVIEGVNAKEGKMPPLSKYLDHFKFTKEKPVQKKEETTVEAVRMRQAHSRMAWGILLDLDIPMDDLVNLEQEIQSGGPA